MEHGQAISLFDDTTVQKKIFVTVNGTEFQRDYDIMGLSFDSSEQEIMDRIIPVIKEEHGVDITGLYKVRKTRNNRNIFVIPNSTAGL